MDKVGKCYYMKENGCKKEILSTSREASIEVQNTILYEDLLEVIYCNLKLDPTNCYVSIKYVFNVNIRTCPIELTNDGDVEFFIGLNSTSYLHVPLFSASNLIGIMVMIRI